MVKLVACQVKSPVFHNDKPNTYNSLSRDFPDRGGSWGRVQGVRTPPPPRNDLRFSNTTGIQQKKKKNYVVYFC